MTSETAKIPKYVNFAFGGTAGTAATLFVQPMDLLKNRMQMSGEGTSVRQHKTSFHAARAILAQEGVRGMYSGLSAGILRQVTYTTTRLGIYSTLYGMVSRDGKPPNFFLKAGVAMVAGACGAFVGTPAEICLIRMTSDGRLPPDQRRNYSNALSALYRIAREEGVLGLWRGAGPTMGRAVVVNAAQLASYSQAKEALIDTGYFGDNISLHACSSMISGLVTTAASVPVDIAKTRIQNMRVVNGVPEYRGALDVLQRVVRNEGFFSLWKGFTPYYARIGPHTLLTFIFLEQMNAAYHKYALGNRQTGSTL